ncbi:uncharacterized protein LOC122507339 [Leptopilina heterotoma]|uniref:uncharacterized protein LOC122504778 n=1 Tax=Leptopilina heterotoma TaxID=63436 RepID=UPI001CA842DE|nr:uncharacterized protein LOC122504778 [Leptopilina heterotoma]XP_043475936.1 uncharacterized protein LOC122507339 [Leptopilina heterotoma]
MSTRYTTVYYDKILLSLVEQNPCIYDKNIQCSYSQESIDNLWTELALFIEKNNIPIKDPKNRWTRLRQNFIRHFNKNNRSWYLFDSMKFLIGHFKASQTSETSCNIPQSKMVSQLVEQNKKKFLQSSSTTARKRSFRDADFDGEFPSTSKVQNTTPTSPNNIVQVESSQSSDNNSNNLYLNENLDFSSLDIASEISYSSMPLNSDSEDSWMTDHGHDYNFSSSTKCGNFPVQRSVENFFPQDSSKSVESSNSFKNQNIFVKDSPLRPIVENNHINFAQIPLENDINKNSKLCNPFIRNPAKGVNILPRVSQIVTNPASNQNNPITPPLDAFAKKKDFKILASIELKMPLSSQQKIFIS